MAHWVSLYIGAAVHSSARSASPAASRPSSSSPQPSSLPQSSANGHAAPLSPLARAESTQAPSESTLGAHVDMLGELPPGGVPKGGVESPSISDDEQYQKLDGDLWQQGQGEGQLGAEARPAGTLVAPSAEPEVQQAETDDRKVRLPLWYLPSTRARAVLGLVGLKCFVASEVQAKNMCKVISDSGVACRCVVLRIVVLKLGPEVQDGAVALSTCSIGYA